jgi:hypothetical protein
MSTSPGYLYVIFHPDYPHQSKIGLAVDPKRRLAAANTWSPTARFQLSGAVHFTDAPLAERVAHRLLAEHRSRGEWFRLHPDEALNALRGLRRRERNRM